MKEGFRPQPENPKQHAPEPGAGPLGIPPPDPEQRPQSEVWKSPELDLSGQAEDAAPAQEGYQSTRVQLLEKENLSLPDQQIEEEMRHIEALVQALKPYESDSPYGLNDASDKAFVILQKILDPYKKRLIEERIVATCHGSMQYHDPHTLDSVLFFFSFEPVDDGDPMLSDVKKKINTSDEWPTGKGRAEINNFSFKEIREDAKLYNEGVRYDREYDWGAEISTAILTQFLR